MFLIYFFVLRFLAIAYNIFNYDAIYNCKKKKRNAVKYGWILYLNIQQLNETEYSSWNVLIFSTESTWKKFCVFIVDVLYLAIMLSNYGKRCTWLPSLFFFLNA